jgi:hypothetical protein
MAQNDPSLSQSAAEGNGRHVVTEEVEVQDWWRPIEREMMVDVDDGGREMW